MHSFKTALTYNMRRAGIIIGLAFFIFFAYRASHDVSNVKIAAGAQRYQSANVISQKGAELKVRPADSEPTVVTVLTSHQTVSTASRQQMNRHEINVDTAAHNSGESIISLENDKATKAYAKLLKPELNSNLQSNKPD